MKFFHSCKSVAEIKKLYRELCKQFHPDKGGDLATMQAINLEYSVAIHKTLAGENLDAEQVEAEILNAEQYKQALNAIINLPGLIIEVCGGWLWVSGNTFPHKSIFKANGFYFAPVKKMWYFRSPEYKTNSHKSTSMEEIRKKYGSHIPANAAISDKLFQEVAAAGIETVDRDNIFPNWKQNYKTQN